MTFTDPITLTGQITHLTPLRVEDHGDLVAAASDGRLWELSYASVSDPAGMAREIERRLKLRETGVMLPFTIRRTDGQIVGMTTYMNIDEPNRRLEIGSTWLANSAQRSGINTEAKLLLLTHAFETLGCIAVEFRTHWLNRQSRRAIERLGAKLDGILRSHKIMPDGSIRDTAAYSIIASEWPAVRGELQRVLRDATSRQSARG